MEVQKTLKFTKEDSQIIRLMIENCNMAAAFFTDDPLNLSTEKGEGLRAITLFSAGHAIEKSHLENAREEVLKALNRLSARKPHALFPAELKDRYMDNLDGVLDQLSVWLDMVK